MASRPEDLSAMPTVRLGDVVNLILAIAVAAFLIFACSLDGIH
jgi:hypothetical protein